ncbi:NAD(+)/NADH kinase [Brenneria populi]|uniref:NAD(+)/NADH kinase n=1 Tax=Brenneria populi TaxID=1505588 RepID=A0ABU6JWD1_9GAMM|nr:NAD(+)/NADH kinase [Brenneria populi Li et al. 2015]
MSDYANAPTADASPSAGWVGIIANPASARDVRRVVGHAGSLTLSDRANLLFRLLAALGACGIREARMMPDREGLQATMTRMLSRRCDFPLPRLSWLAMEPRSTVNDTFQAARLMRASAASAILVLGGDGTHRAVARECGAVPIAGISTGTNNAWPEPRESTIVGLAIGLYVSGKVPPARALRWNKWLDVSINANRPDARRDIAIVDAAILAERLVGSRSIWHTDRLSQLYLSFAEPHAVGLSAIGGLLMPVARDEPGGLKLTFGPGGTVVNAPVAPGVLRPIPVARWRPIAGGAADSPLLRRGVIALDGERELLFGPQDKVRVSLREQAFRAIDVNACLHYAAANALLRDAAGDKGSPL